MVKKVMKQESSLDEVLAVTSDEFEKLAIETEWDADEPKDGAKDQAIKLSRLHFEQVAPQINPVSVQEEFVVEMEGLDYDVGGAIDLTDQNGFIRDTKTSSRQASGRYQIERSFQPTMYSFAYEAVHGKKPKGFVFDILKKPSVKLPAEYEQRTGIVTDSDVNWLFNSINRVHTAIGAGVALPAPEGAWWCSKDWCGYWSMCKGKNT